MCCPVQQQLHSHRFGGIVNSPRNEITRTKQRAMTDKSTQNMHGATNCRSNDLIHFGMDAFNAKHHANNRLNDSV